MKLQLPGGTEHDPKSKRYNQLLEDWLANKSLDFPFGAGAVTSPDETLQVKPAQ